MRKRWLIWMAMFVSFVGYGQVGINDFALNTIRTITLVDQKDENTQLAQQLFRPLTVFVFLSPECPLCKNYSVVLNSITREFSSDSVSLIGIVPGRAYGVADINRFAAEYSLAFPVFMDPDKKLSNYLRATITPEVVVLNPKGTPVYRGAIDDWVTELGKNKLQPEKHYLRLALDESIRQQPVSIKKTRPKGCYINEY